MHTRSMRTFSISILGYKCAKKVKRLGLKIKNRDENAIGELMDALVLVGVLMSFAGSSRPASGSEHHLSHYFEITGILNNTDYFAHGIDVVYSATFLARIRGEMLMNLPKRLDFNQEAYEKEIKRIYTTSATEVLTESFLTCCSWVIVSSLAQIKFPFIFLKTI